MTDISLDKLLTSLIRNVTDMQRDFKSLEDVIRQLPRETSPDLRPDLKKLYELCLELSQGKEFKATIAQQAQKALDPLKENLLATQSRIKTQLSDQIQALSEAVQRMILTFDTRTTAIASCLITGVFCAIFSAGYGFRYYQDKALVDKARSDLNFSALQFEVAKSIESQGQEMINSNKTFKEFIKNGNRLQWLRCKEQGTVRPNTDGRRICNLNLWLDPPK